MKRVVLLAGVLALAGCGERAQAYRECARDAGPRDMAAASLFGALGAATMLASDDDTAWRGRVVDCYETQRLARGL